MFHFDGSFSQVAALRPNLHVFGHTHIPIDLVLNPDPTSQSNDDIDSSSSSSSSRGSSSSSSSSRTKEEDSCVDEEHLTRFLQWPLGYPKEHRRQTASVVARGPLLVWRSDGVVPANSPLAASSIRRSSTGSSSSSSSSRSVDNERLSNSFGVSKTAARTPPPAADHTPAREKRPIFGRLQPPVPTYWGDYYRAHARNPSVTTQAPWVQEFHRRAKAQRSARAAAQRSKSPVAPAEGALQEHEIAAVNDGKNNTDDSTSSITSGVRGVASVDREIHSASVDGLWEKNRNATNFTTEGN